MSQVASDPIVQLPSRPYTQSQRQNYAADAAPAAPFDSLLDDDASSTPSAPPRNDPAPRASAADRPDRAARASDDDKSSRSTSGTTDSQRPNAAGGTKTAKDADSAKDNGKAKSAKTSAKDTKDAKSTGSAKDGKDSDTGKASDTGKSDSTAKAADPVATVAAVIVPAQTAAAAGTKADGKTDVADATAPVADAAQNAAAKAAQGTQNTEDAAKTGGKTGDKTDASASDAAKGQPLTKEQSDALAALAAEAAPAGTGDKAGKGDKAAAGQSAKDDAKQSAAGVSTHAVKAEAKLEPKPAANAKTPLPADPNAQPQGIAPESAKDAHARAQESADGHRGIATDSANGSAKPNGTDNASAAVAPKSADIAQPAALTTQAQTQAQAQTQVQAQVPPAPALAAAPIAAAANAHGAEAAVPPAGVAFEITSKIMSGKNQFDIRLDPPDLGRIHVRLDVDHNGNVISHLVADRTDTLDMLRRDTAGLERALQDAGLKTSDNSLQFSLRDQTANQQQQQQQNNNGSNTARLMVDDQQTMSNEPVTRQYARYAGQTGGLDIRV